MRLVAIVCFAISVGSVTACVVGDPTPGTTGTPGGGDDNAGDDDQSPAPDAGDGQQIDCEPAATVIPDGHHNAGQACLTCHNGNGAPAFTVAGTLYSSGAGILGVSGATIRVTDAAGTEIKIVTANDGNFYTSQAVQLPLTVAATKCPDLHAMPGTANSGDCNGCHSAGAAQGRVHLP